MTAKYAHQLHLLMGEGLTALPHQVFVNTGWIVEGKKMTCPFTKPQLLKLLDIIGDDGHTIFDANGLAEDIGVDVSLFSSWTKDHVSDGTPKGDITRYDGRIAEHMVGIYGLLLLRSLATMLNLKWKPCLGRGWEAREITKVLRQHLSQPQESQPESQPQETQQETPNV